MELNKDLVLYIEQHIFPRYEKYYSHGMIHINNVIKNMLFLSNYYNLDKNNERSCRRSQRFTKRKT